VTARASDSCLMLDYVCVINFLSLLFVIIIIIKALVRCWSRYFPMSVSRCRRHLLTDEWSPWPASRDM